MAGRVLTWAGGVIAVGSAGALVVYYAVAGFHLLDTLGWIGAVLGIAGLVLAIYGIATSRRAGEGERQDRPPGPSVTQKLA